MKDYDIKEEERKFDDTMTCATCAVGFSTATTSFISLITGCFNKPETIPYFVAGGIILTPIFYVLSKKIRKRQDERFEKDIIAAGNLITMLSEAQKPDRIIDEKTSLFLTEVALAFDNNKIEMGGDSLIHINQFLFLINVNYYDRIIPKNSSITREKLTDHIINQIVVYYKHNDKRSFNENDAKEILKYCVLVSPELKEEISNEFKDSKVKIGKTIEYAIRRKDISNDWDSYSVLTDEIKNGEGINFDITNIEHYQTAITAICEGGYLNQYGNPCAVEWDMEYLYRIMNLVVADHRQKLIELDPKYTNTKLVLSFIYKALTYALVNKRQKVGQKELLSTFKSWDYVPFAMQDKVLTKLFEEDGLDYSLHPYRLRRDPALDEKTKVIKIGQYTNLTPNKNETTDH